MSTLSTIRANVRRNLGETTARFYTDADLNEFVGQSFYFYTVMMIEEGEGYFEATENLAITADTATVSLSALTNTFFKVSALEKNTSNGSIPLIEDERRFHPNFTVVTGTGDAYRPTWKLRGTSIVLEPTPLSTESASATTGLKLDYYYIPTRVISSSSDSTTYDSNFPVIYEPMIELHATIAALEAKDGMGGVSDINSFRGRLEKWEQIFLDSLNRSEFPDRVSYSGVDYSNINNWRL